MRVLVTGHEGYIGTVMAPFIAEAGHDVCGLDAGFYDECVIGGDTAPPSVADTRLDIRDIERRHLEGFDAVIHLAALSNDPLGDLDPELTYDINHKASRRLARLAREAGVERFLFASSCSLYGVAGDSVLLDETAEFNPITPYGKTKVMMERDLSGLASSEFSPTYMRNATVYGFSPRFRADIVVNNLVGLAHTTGEIVLTSDGSPWRPLVHVEDVCRAFLSVLEAPRERVHDTAFNVGRTGENYQIQEIAEIVADAMPDTRISLADGASADPRDYRVDCSRLAETLPDYSPQWTVPDGVLELRDAFRRHGLDEDDVHHRCVRLERIAELQEKGLLDAHLRWSEQAVPHTGP